MEPSRSGDALSHELARGISRQFIDSRERHRDLVTREAIRAEADRVSKQLGYELIVPVKSVWARKSKRARAEPVGALYERARVHHIGYFPELESELVGWMPGFGMDSPNRLDALVHGITHLLLGEKEIGPISAYLKG